MILIIKNDERPKLCLSSHKHYEVAVVQAAVKLNTRNLNFGLLSIKSNLVDSSVSNSNQLIVNFPIDAKKSWYHANPAFVTFQRLTLRNLEYVSFELIDTFDNTFYPCEKFFIKLEIRETNDWLQHIN